VGHSSLLLETRIDTIPDMSPCASPVLRPGRELSGLKFRRGPFSRQGAIGDICFRYFDAQGEPVKSALMQRVIGIEPSSLKRDRRAARLCWRATNVRLDRFNCDQCCAVPTALHKAVTARYMKG